MAKFIEQPTRIEAVGNKPKLIDEFFRSCEFWDCRDQHCSHAEPFWMGGTRADTGV